MRTKLGWWGLGLATVILVSLAASAAATDAYRRGSLSLPLYLGTVVVLALIATGMGYLGVLRPLAKNSNVALASCRDILDSSADAVFIVGPGSRIEFASSGAIRLLGYSGRELIGLPTSHLIDDASAVQVKRDVLMSSESEVVGLTCDVRVSRKDGVSLPMSLAISETGHGRHKRRVWVLRDISDVRRMQIELERSEDRFKALAECSPVAVFQIDTYGGLLYCNNKMLGLFGLRREDLIGGGWAEWINPEEREDFLNQLRQSAIQGVGFARELRIIQSDRNLCWTRCSFSPLRRNDGSLIGFVGSLEDITEIRASRENLDSSRACIGEALDTFNVGFAIWDPEDRLVICNPAYRALYPEVSHALVPGMPYREVLRIYLESGGKNPFGSEEAFYTHWTIKLHHTGEPWDAMLQGRRIRTSAARSASGNTVVLLLEQPRPQLERDLPYAQALDHLPMGLAVFDRDGKPIAHNPLYFEFAELMNEVTQCGTTAIGDMVIANSEAPDGQRVCLAGQLDKVASSPFELALESLDLGVVLYGPDDRIAYANESVRTMFPDLREALTVGSNREEIFRTQFRTLNLTRLGVSEPDWIKRRLEDTKGTGAIDDPQAIVAGCANGYQLVLHPSRRHSRAA